MSTKENEVLRDGMLVMFAVFLLPIHLLLDALALSILWRWFLVPFGLPEISLVQAAGLSLLGGFIAHQSNPDCGETKREWFKRLLGVTFANPLLALFIGWIIHLMM